MVNYPGEEIEETIVEGSVVFTFLGKTFEDGHPTAVLLRMGVKERIPTNSYEGVGYRTFFLELL